MFFKGTHLNHHWCSKLVLEVSLEPVEPIVLLSLVKWS